MSRRRAAAVLVTLVALAGCGTSATVPTPGVTPSVSASPLPALWSVHGDAAQGFSVAVPDAWDFVFRDSRTLDADLKVVEQHSPELATYFRQSLAAHEQLRFLAADSRSLPSGFATNVQVMTADLGPAGIAPSLKDLTDAKVRALRLQASVTQPVARVADQLGGRPALRLDYTLATPAAAATGAGAGATADAGAGAPGTALVRSYLMEVLRGPDQFEVELTIGARPETAATTFQLVSEHFSP